MRTGHATPMRILAVVVTHNRRELLERCLDHIEQQSRTPDAILVVNNGSTDDTVGMLRERGVDFVTQENLGSAGGWACGIQRAMHQGFDAIWLMDDDGFPGGDALRTLEKKMTPDVACASSVVLCEDRPTHFVFPMARLDKRQLPVIFRAKRKIATLEELREASPDGVYPLAYLFNGALVSLQAVRKIGNVDTRFFIFGEDVDYLFRLREAGTVISVLGAAQFHPDVSRRPYTAVKIYYYVKNTIILNSRYFNMVGLRNLLTVAAALGRTARRNGLLTALSYLAGWNAYWFYLAVIRGLQGRVGRDFAG
jgi:rhamnopyranosyl-N-acetylglucosaminyl-diphospho-decaprenol beta-1,3/1,4-galactofuranosyltransferase